MRCIAARYFVRPTALANVSPELTIAREEIFGPVILVLLFDTEDEALHLANTTEYGLRGVVWTRNLSTAIRVIDGIKAGSVWVNCYGWDIGIDMAGYRMSGDGIKGGRLTSTRPCTKGACTSSRDHVRPPHRRPPDPGGRNNAQT